MSDRPSPPRAAYIHVPFCAHRCGYCSFTVVAGRDDLVDVYLQALEKELNRSGEVRPVQSIFLGGGTPTRLAIEPLTRLLEMIARVHPLEIGGEYSAEANPLDVTPEVAATLADHGVNRLSLGAQSFHPPTLKALERDHAPDQIVRAVEHARTRIENVSLDLIFAGPQQDLALWNADLDAALRLAPSHISTYGLTYERGTQFWNRRQKGELSEVDEELQAAMYETGIDRLTAAGYEHYEASNFARPGRRCRHNEVYWAGEEYFAYGPGASRYVGGTRETNHRSTTTWIKRVLAGDDPTAERETLAPLDRAREAAVFGLRRLDGWRRDDFLQRTGVSLDELLGPLLPQRVAQGFLIDDGARVRLTRAGLLVSDSLWPDFLGG
ncbi:MAG TPA: radical SAM family heme chaperone HemW [Pirellulales bacterium]